MKRLFGTSLAGLMALAMLVATSTATVLAQDECVLDIEPSEGPAGTQFTLSGSGYTPDQLILQRGSADPVTFEIDLGDADPFSIPIGSRVGDEGPWTATVVETETDCRATATFRVTLQSTDMIDDLLAVPGGAGLPPIVYLLLIVGGFAAGTLIPRLVGVRV